MDYWKKPVSAFKEIWLAQQHLLSLFQSSPISFLSANPGKTETVPVNAYILTMKTV